MKKVILPCLLLCWFLRVDLCTADDQNINKSVKILDQYIQNQINEKKAIGCAVAVVDHGKIIFIKAYGSRKKGEKSPVNLKTIFQLGSISKPISATLVAILVKENLLKFDSPMINWYSEISSETTVQHVLSHTTGYKRTGWNQKIEEYQSRESLLKQLALSQQNKPGHEYDYHNMAYSLIEEVVIASLQQTFKDSLETKLFHPLAMREVMVGDLDFNQQPNVAWPHKQNKKGIMQPCKNYSRAYHRSVSSAGGLSANITDMAIFLQLQLGARPDILEVQDLLPFQTPVISAPDALNWFKQDIKGDLKSYYGLGWRILDNNEKRIIFHGGWLKGFQNFLGFMPDRQVGIVILHNGESSLSTKAAMMFFNSL